MNRTTSKVSQCLYSVVKSLRPLWAVRPLEKFSACTNQLNFTPPTRFRLIQLLSACKVEVNLNSPMVCAASTEPRCL